MRRAAGRPRSSAKRASASWPATPEVDQLIDAKVRLGIAPFRRLRRAVRDDPSSTPAKMATQIAPTIKSRSASI
jgi:hypothetical protein